MAIHFAILGNYAASPEIIRLLRIPIEMAAFSIGNSTKHAAISIEIRSILGWQLRDCLRLYEAWLISERFRVILLVGATEGSGHWNITANLLWNLVLKIQKEWRIAPEKR